jgi:hypothetical protein
MLKHDVRWLHLALFLATISVLEADNIMVLLFCAKSAASDGLAFNFRALD